LKNKIQKTEKNRHRGRNADDQEREASSHGASPGAFLSNNLSSAETFSGFFKSPQGLNKLRVANAHKKSRKNKRGLKQVQPLF